ncbi:hypothetical protein BJ878DRAFT_419812 [Calycina marina]|uniref:Uncharacterized protein n=1 Tax=Calycina marina TaxID=1763456 RepID=A0A9P7Z5A3_9HELO|nr:hypothetical protein BJ878DRAFT_419812 [Calycina marina]
MTKDRPIDRKLHSNVNTSRPPRSHNHFRHTQPQALSSTLLTTSPVTNRNGNGNGNAHSQASPPPGFPNRMNSVQTRYMNMLLNLDTIPRLHNIMAAFFSWIMLAGYVTFPGTFTSLQGIDAHSSVGKAILEDAKSLPLLYVAALCSGFGGLGMLWFWWRWRKNFVWLVNRIFLPGCLNALAGLISTLVNVYAQQDGKWSITAWITAAVTGGIAVVMGVLFVFYNFVILRSVKKSHGRDMEQATGHEGEGLAEKIERYEHDHFLKMKGRVQFL